MSKTIPLTPVQNRILASLEHDGPGTEAEIHGALRHWKLAPTLDDLKATLTTLAQSGRVRCEHQGGRRIWYIVMTNEAATNPAPLRMAS